MGSLGGRDRASKKVRGTRREKRVQYSRDKKEGDGLTCGNSENSSKS